MKNRYLTAVAAATLAGSFLALPAAARAAAAATDPEITDA